MLDQKPQPPMTNPEAYALAERIKDQYYKFSVKADDIVTGLSSAASLKSLGPDKLKRFVYSTLDMLHELDVKGKAK